MIYLHRTLLCQGPSKPDPDAAATETLKLEKQQLAMIVQSSPKHPAPRVLRRKHWAMASVVGDLDLQPHLQLPPLFAVSFDV